MGITIAVRTAVRAERIAIVAIRRERLPGWGGETEVCEPLERVSPWLEEGVVDDMVIRQTDSIIRLYKAVVSFLTRVPTNDPSGEYKHLFHVRSANA